MRRLIAVTTVATAAASAAAAPALAEEVTLSFDIPRLNVAEYHRPYLAVWLEKPDQSPVAPVALWYETGRDNHGLRYVKDLRQFWRKLGRGMTLPADGVTGATKAPGPQKITFTTAKPPIAGLTPGPYALVFEVTREAGGRDTLRMPVNLPLKKGATAQVAGGEELGAVKLTVR